MSCVAPSLYFRTACFFLCCGRALQCRSVPELHSPDPHLFLWLLLAISFKPHMRKVLLLCTSQSVREASPPESPLPLCGPLEKVSIRFFCNGSHNIWYFVAIYIYAHLSLYICVCIYIYIYIYIYIVSVITTQLWCCTKTARNDMYLNSMAIFQWNFMDLKFKFHIIFTYKILFFQSFSIVETCRKST
jgi:hypothetical protein